MLATWAVGRQWAKACAATDPRPSVDPRDRHADRLLPRVPARRAPPPIFRALDETRLHGVPVHVFELLQQLSFAIDVKHIGFGLPKPLARPETGKVVGGMGGIPLANSKAAHPLPAMEKPSDVFRIGQPNEGMHVVGHEDKPNALGIERLQQMVKHAQHDSFRLIEIEQPPALENRECHEEDVSLVGKSSSPVAMPTILGKSGATVQEAG